MSQTCDALCILCILCARSYVLISFLVRVNNWIRSYYAEQMHLILQLWKLSHLMVLISNLWGFLGLGFFFLALKQKEVVFNLIFFTPYIL